MVQDRLSLTEDAQMQRLTVASGVATLDLEAVKSLLRVNRPWSDAQCDLVEVWYRRYLTLAVLYPDETLRPTPEIDEFWHHHILCTHKYAEDCDRVFGRFLHHSPDSVDSDRADHEAASTWTNEMLAAFGEPLEDLTRRFRRESRSLASLVRD
jgi:hypothetical protein